MWTETVVYYFICNNECEFQKFWDHLMRESKKWGLITYEQVGFLTETEKLPGNGYTCTCQSVACGAYLNGTYYFPAASRCHPNVMCISWLSIKSRRLGFEIQYFWLHQSHQ